MYFGARYYDSEVSVWLSVDPLADRFPDLSPYAYVYNNPMNYNDAWGLWGDKTKAEKQRSKAVDKYGEEKVGMIYKKGDDYRFRISKTGFGIIKGDKIVEGAHASAHGANAEVISSKFDYIKYRAANYLDNNNPAGILADYYRYSPLLYNGGNITLNPFIGAEAISGDVGILVGGAETDAGGYFVLAGEDRGKVLPYHEIAGGGAPEASATIEIGRVDVSGNISNFNADRDLYGEREKFFGGAGIFPVSISGAFTKSETEDGRKVRTYSISGGLGASLFGGSIGYNKGEIR